MVKEFQPYSNLWLTSTNWFKNSVHWLQDDWESLDAEHCERFMEDAIKTMAIVNRFFKERDIGPV
jgi:dynein heavy chain, axonemal